MFDGNVSNLIASLKRRGSVPTRQNLFDEDDFLEFLTEEMQTELVPTVIKAREDFYLTYRDFQVVPITSVSSAGFGNEDFGLLPFGGTVPITFATLLNRSIGTRIKDMHLITQSGEVTGHIPRITLDDISTFSGFGGFYFQGNDIIFHPKNIFNQKYIRIYFYRLPNRLTQSQNCAKVQFINIANSTITIDAIPNTDWVPNFSLDIIQGQQGYESVLDDVLITNVTGNVLELSQISQKISPGDWVCPAGEACVAQMPVVAYPLLAQLGSAQFLESFGRTLEADKANIKYEKMKANFKDMLQPRSEMQKKKIVSRRGLWTY